MTSNDDLSVLNSVDKTAVDNSQKAEFLPQVFREVHRSDSVSYRKEEIEKEV